MNLNFIPKLYCTRAVFLRSSIKKLKTFDDLSMIYQLLADGRIDLDGSISDTQLDQDARANADNVKSDAIRVLAAQLVVSPGLKFLFDDKMELDSLALASKIIRVCQRARSSSSSCVFDCDNLEDDVKDRLQIILAEKSDQSEHGTLFADDC